MGRWDLVAEGAVTCAVRAGGETVTRARFLDSLVDDPALRAALTELLRASPHRAFAWEMPVVSAATADRPAELAILDSPALARVAPDPEPFSAQLRGQRIATFPNLGGDAVLVAPSPQVAPDAAHLAAFVRAAASDVIDDLWVAVGRAARERARRPAPFWLSTAGLGVHWLHVRLDDRPKYYRHRAYVDSTY